MENWGGVVIFEGGGRKNWSDGKMNKGNGLRECRITVDQIQKKRLNETLVHTSAWTRLLIIASRSGHLTSALESTCSPPSGLDIALVFSSF